MSPRELAALKTQPEPIEVLTVADAIRADLAAGDGAMKSDPLAHMKYRYLPVFCTFCGWKGKRGLRVIWPACPRCHKAYTVRHRS